MEIFLSITMTWYLNRIHRWNFSVNDYTTQWHFMKIRLSILKFVLYAKRNQYLSKFFPCRAIFGSRVYRIFLVKLVTTCFVFIKIRCKLSSKRFVRAWRSSVWKSGEREKGIKLSILKLIASNDSDSRWNGLIPCFYLETGIHGSRYGVASINTFLSFVYQSSLYLPRSLSFPSENRLENSRGVNHRDIRLDLSGKHFKTRQIREGDLFWNKFWWYHYLLRGISRIKTRWILSCETPRIFLHNNHIDIRSYYSHWFTHIIGEYL